MLNGAASCVKKKIHIYIRQGVSEVAFRWPVYDTSLIFVRPLFLFYFIYFR